MSGEDVGRQRERRQRNPPLHPALYFQQFEMHIDGIGKLRLSLLESAQFDDFPGI